jgi:hypothetical protein
VAAVINMRVNKLADQVVQMSLAEDNVLVQALQLDRFDEPFAPAIQVRACFRQRVGPYALRFELGGKIFGELGVLVVRHDIGLLFTASSLIIE